MKNFLTCQSPVGPLYLVSEEDDLIGLYFQKPKDFKVSVSASVQNNSILKEAEKQLNEYFSGHRKTFNLKIRFQGTDFQKKAWLHLQKIPYGKTKSYTEQAAAAGFENATRAIGTANGRNPISIIVPCHRVIRADGSLGGYGGGLPTKKFLLSLETKFS